MERVAVLGTGLIGTSIALALREGGVEVALADPDAAALRLARDLGAGAVLAPGDGPADIAIVAAPPATVPTVLRDAQDRGLAHAYTDVASVKGDVLAGAERQGCDLATFVPGHPMGGRERSGPSAARSYIFQGRSWVLCPTGKADSAAVHAATEVARLCGAHPVLLDAAAHDRAVALVSHAPHAVSAAVAARLLDGAETELALAGQGLRDITRVASGDPGLWREILRHNSGPVADVLIDVADDLARVARALRAGGDPDPEGAPARDLLERGRRGQGRIPGKHGAHLTPDYTLVPVVLPDEPGALGRLFAAVGEAGINIEDVRMDHSPGQPLGVAQLSVLPVAAGELARILTGQGWSVHI